MLMRVPVMRRARTMPADAARRRPAGLPRRHRRAARGRRRARRVAAARGRRGRRGARRARARVAHLRADRARVGALGARRGAGGDRRAPPARGPLLLHHRRAARARAGRDPLRRARRPATGRAATGSGSGRSSGGGWRARSCWCRGARAGSPRRRSRTRTRSSCRCRWRRAGPAAERDIAAITYGANPEKKGLDRVLAAWAARAAARTRSWSWPDSTAPAAEGVRFTGMLPRAEYRALLRRARVFVCAPRREDYGIAQLEALADGCVLVTTPSPGPYAALPVARALDDAARLRASRRRRPHGARRSRPGLRRARAGGARAVAARGGRPRRSPSSCSRGYSRSHDPAFRPVRPDHRRRPRHRRGGRAPAGRPRRARLARRARRGRAAARRRRLPGLGGLRRRRHRPGGARRRRGRDGRGVRRHRHRVRERRHRRARLRAHDGPGGRSSASSRST